MLAWLFLKLTKITWFRRIVWKPVYQTLAKQFPVESWHYMNYGYVPFDHEPALELDAADEMHRYPLQLYHYLALKGNVAGKEVLEVGSGRGGGSYHIATYLKPASVIGMDIAPNAVAFSNRVHQAPNLKYIAGNAESIPLPDNSVDVVINVESSHAYGSVPIFLNEVKRVLRPGGLFLITDTRSQPGMAQLKEELEQSGMTKLSEEDITDNVVAAIGQEDAVKWKRIREAVPPKWHKAFGEFSGTVGSQIHLQHKSRELIYYRFVYRND
jgi:ubiquinone/menaquinone biosynthesis C-methylase UbiE